MSSRLVSSVCSSPMEPSLPSPPWSDLLPTLCVTSLATESSIVIQVAVLNPEKGAGTAKQR